MTILLLILLDFFLFGRGRERDEPQKLKKISIGGVIRNTTEYCTCSPLQKNKSYVATGDVFAFEIVKEMKNFIPSHSRKVLEGVPLTNAFSPPTHCDSALKKPCRSKRWFRIFNFLPYQHLHSTFSLSCKTPPFTGFNTQSQRYSLDTTLTGNNGRWRNFILQIILWPSKLMARKSLDIY